MIEKIHKKISLEQFKTRYPLTYPALDNGDIVYVNQDTLGSYQNANYGLIPLNLDESICGSFGLFTAEMYRKYHGTVLGYKTLEKWFFEFRKYYELIYSGNCNNLYTNAEQYYRHISNGDIVNVSHFKKLDAQHAERGGDKFYEWLSANYFINVDLKYLYKMGQANSLDISMNYGEWVSCVNNLHKDFLSYPDACELLRQMKAWKLEFGEKNCSVTDNCCGCHSFNDYGGNDMVLLLQYWVDSVGRNIETLNNVIKNKTDKHKIISNIELKINLKKQVADFGNYTIFCKEYSPSREYVMGEACIYEGDVYVLITNTAHKFNETTLRNEINLWTATSPNGWYSYTKQYKAEHITDDFWEFPTWDKTYILSGRTTSSLESFRWSVDTLDNIGNILPGHFVPFSGSTFVQPAEGSWLDLEYEVGRAHNVSLFTEEGVYTGYTGDFLSGITLYMKDSSGNTINSTITQCNVGDFVPSKVDECYLKASSLIDVVDTVYADFTYFKNTIFNYADDGEIIPRLMDGVIYGVKYIEHCYLQQMTCSYYLSQTELYPIKYYSVIRDSELTETSYSNETITVNMSDFYFTPSIYESENTVVCPMIRREELLGVTGPEKVTNTIYIDRGYATVLDQHLRMGDITSFEALERYGNSSLNIINSQEQKI